VIEALTVTVFPHLSHGGMTDLGEWVLASGVVIALSFGLASVSWYALEKPILRAAQAWRPREAGTRYTPGWRTWASAGVALVLVLVPLVVALANPYTLELPLPWFD